MTKRFFLAVLFLLLGFCYLTYYSLYEWAWPPTKPPVETRYMIGLGDELLCAIPIGSEHIGLLKIQPMQPNELGVEVGSTGVLRVQCLTDGYPLPIDKPIIIAHQDLPSWQTRSLMVILAENEVKFILIEARQPMSQVWIATVDPYGEYEVEVIDPPTKTVRSKP